MSTSNNVMSDERGVVPDILEEPAKPDTTLDPLPDTSECDRKTTKRVKKPRKSR